MPLVAPVISAVYLSCFGPVLIKASPSCVSSGRAAGGFGRSHRRRRFPRLGRQPAPCGKTGSQKAPARFRCDATCWSELRWSVFRWLHPSRRAAAPAKHRPGKFQTAPVRATRLNAASCWDAFQQETFRLHAAQITSTKRFLREVQHRGNYPPAAAMLVAERGIDLVYAASVRPGEQAVELLCHVGIARVRKGPHPQWL